MLNMWRNASRSTRAVAVLVGFVIVLFVWALALGGSGGGRYTKSYLAAMKSDLRNLMTMQEAHLLDHHVYFSGVGLSRDGMTVQAGDYWPSQGIKLMVSGDSSGWAAAALHERLPGTICFAAMWVDSDGVYHDAEPFCPEQ